MSEIERGEGGNGERIYRRRWRGGACLVTTLTPIIYA